MIELDKTPLRRGDIRMLSEIKLDNKIPYSYGIKLQRLLGVVEGLKEEWCICHHLYDDEKCSTCNKINEFFGVLK